MWQETATDVWESEKCGARLLRVRRIGNEWAWFVKAIPDGEVVDEGFAPSADDAKTAAEESEA
jgi:hypothetical protein